jgi:hypothetical protein
MRRKAFGDEAGIRQDAGVGVQLGVTVGAQQIAESGAQGGAQFRAGAENVAEGLQVSPGGLEIAGNRGPDFADQQHQQRCRIGVRDKKAAEQLFHCGRGLAG